MFMAQKITRDNSRANAEKFLLSRKVLGRFWRRKLLVGSCRKLLVGSCRKLRFLKTPPHTPHLSCFVSMDVLAAAASFDKTCAENKKMKRLLVELVAANRALVQKLKDVEADAEARMQRLTPPALRGMKLS